MKRLARIGGYRWAAVSTIVFVEFLPAFQGLLAGEDVSGFDRKRLTTYRRHEVGFVFQFYNLLPNMTALENVQDRKSTRLNSSHAR